MRRSERRNAHHMKPESCRRQGDRCDRPVLHSQRRHRADQSPEPQEASEPNVPPDRSRVFSSHQVEALPESELELEGFRHGRIMPLVSGDQRITGLGRVRSGREVRWNGYQTRSASGLVSC
jgi:hypothetical protein